MTRTTQDIQGAANTASIAAVDVALNAAMYAITSGAVGAVATYRTADVANVIFRVINVALKELP